MAVTDVEEGRLDPLLLDRLAVDEGHLEGRLVQPDRLVEIGDGDADVVDQTEHGAECKR